MRSTGTRSPQQETATATPHARPHISVTVTPRSIWLAAGIAVATLVVGYVLAKSISVVIIFFISIIFAEGIRPIVEWLHRGRIPRPLAVLLIYLALLAVFLGLAWLLLSPLLTQLGSFSTNVPHYLSRVQSLIAQLQARISSNPQLSVVASNLGSQLSGLAGSLVPFLLRAPLLLGEIVGGVVVVITIAFFWLTGTQQLKPFVVSLFPPAHQATVTDLLTDMGHKIGGYLRGVVFNMFVIGILSGTGDYFLRVPYPALLGIVAGMTEILPYVGPWISGGVALVVALIAVGPLKAGEVIVLYIIIQEIEGNTLVPLVMNRAVELNPISVILAVFVGASLLGIVGGILAVPAAAALKVLVVRVFAPAAREAVTPPGDAARETTAEDQRGTSPPASSPAT